MPSCPLDSSRLPRPRAPSPFVTSVPLTLFVDRLFREFTLVFCDGRPLLPALSTSPRYSRTFQFRCSSTRVFTGRHIPSISCSFSPFSILMTVSVRCRVRICYLLLCMCWGLCMHVRSVAQSFVLSSFLCLLAPAFCASRQR